MVIAFALALIASLSVHLPVYEVLGDLADRLRAAAEEAQKEREYNPVEVDFEVAQGAKSERAQKKPRERQKAEQAQKKVAQAIPVPVFNKRPSRARTGQIPDRKNRKSVRYYVIIIL